MTTNDVIVSPQIAGQLQKLLVKEGDIVKKGQLLAVISPDELRADTAFYTHNGGRGVAGLASRRRRCASSSGRPTSRSRQAESALAASDAQVHAAERRPRDMRGSRSTRTQDLRADRIASAQELDQARTAFDAAQAKVDALGKQVDAQRATVALARSNAEQIAMRRSQVQANRALQAAAAAQRTKADVRLSYTEIHAPIDGIVDVRAARAGEVVNAGQPIVTLINPDDLWVRADVEETYIDRCASATR